MNRRAVNRLPEPSEDEEDMLDEAVCLTASSRLGCQIVLSKVQRDMERRGEMWGDMGRLGCQIVLSKARALDGVGRIIHSSIHSFHSLLRPFLHPLIHSSQDLEGMEITLPAYSKNFYVDGHVPEPH